MTNCTWVRSDRTTLEHLSELLLHLRFDRPFHHAKKQRKVDLHAHFSVAHLHGPFRPLRRTARGFEDDAVSIPTPVEIEPSLHGGCECLRALSRLFFRE